MTYKELMAWGMKHYNEGGDVFVECWEESDFNEYVREFGPMTEKAACSLASIYEGVKYYGVL